MKNIIGKKFGRLTVLKFHHNSGKPRYENFFECKCECGNLKVCSMQNLISGNTQSCGCIKKEQTIQMFTKHGKRHTRLYRIWLNMKNRCNNKKSKCFYYYGGKGIKIYDEWLNDFMSFYNWSMSHGYRDDLTIDRIDNNKDYCPENCRWVTYLQQGRNTERNHLLTINGETRCICEWAEYVGICKDTIYNRMKKGLSGEDLIKPTKYNKK